MTKLSAWKRAGALFVLYVSTVIAAHAQTFTTLFDFDYTNGTYPYYMSLVQGKDGNLYGTADAGGAHESGTFLKVNGAGALTTLYNFCAYPGCTDGVNPQGTLVLATDGNFYGITFSGGSYAQCFYGCGTIFKITPSGMLSTLHTFCTRPNCTDGQNPAAGLLQAKDGSFYGMTTQGGANGHGTIFNMNSAGTVTTLYSFCGQADCADGYLPGVGLIQADDGNFYATTAEGGNSTCINGCGTVFRFTPAGKLTTLHSFDSTDGAYPVGLVQGIDGMLYGTASQGGNNTCDSPNGCGTVFKIDTGGKFTTLHTFDLSDGAFPNAAMVQGTDGHLYGTTYQGGDLTCFLQNGCGTIFEISSDGTLTLLHAFQGADGLTPYDGLVQDTDGIFYGVTGLGGNLSCHPPYGCGSIFSLSSGLGPFVAFVRSYGKIGQTGGILGQGLTGTTNVSLNGIPASFTVVSDTFIRATVPPGATTGYVTVTTPSGTLTSNVPFHVIP